LRAHLAEFGIVAAQRRTGLRELLAVVADPEDRRLPSLARELLRVLAEQLRSLEERTAELDRRLAAVSGIGSAIATALVAAVGDDRTARPEPPRSDGRGTPPRPSRLKQAVRQLSQIPHNSRLAPSTSARQHGTKRRLRPDREGAPR